MIEWRKSSHSGAGDDRSCVELAALDTGIAIRDSKSPNTGYLVVPRDRFQRMISRIRRAT